jgi:hypothetical protein
MRCIKHLSSKFLGLVSEPSNKISFRSLALKTSKNGWWCKLMRVWSLICTTMASFFLWRIYLLRLAWNINLGALRRIIAISSCIQASSLWSFPVAILAWIQSSGIVHHLFFIHQFLSLNFIGLHNINGCHLLPSMLILWAWSDCLIILWGCLLDVVCRLLWCMRSLFRASLARVSGGLVDRVTWSPLLWFFLIFNLLKLLWRCQVEIVDNIRNIRDSLTTALRSLLDAILSLNFLFLNLSTFILRRRGLWRSIGPWNPRIYQWCLLINFYRMILKMISTLGFNVLIKPFVSIVSQISGVCNALI